MARCDEGYVCDICGDEVEEIVDSDLYLRFVLGEVDPMTLPNHPERHVRCNPALAQYVVDARFESVSCTGIFAKENMDADYVAQEEQRVTRAWQRLQEIPGMGIPLHEYPLSESCKEE